MREIASRARVAPATIFLYADDKCELLLMVVNDELDRITSASQPGASKDVSLSEQLVEFFRPRYAFWARYPEISRAAMREMATSRPPSEAGAEAARGEARRAKTVGKVCDILAAHVNAGTIRPSLDIDAMAWIIMAIYLTEVRLWLNDADPAVELGLARLRRPFDVLVAGLRPC